MHSITEKARHPTATLCVANLHVDTSDAELRSLFLRCGVAGMITLWSAPLFQAWLTSPVTVGKVMTS